MDIHKEKIEINDTGLKTLIQNILSDLNEDLTEAQENINSYKIKMSTDEVSFDAYGNLYNDSLKVKGSIRDKVIKIAAMIKDRVTNDKKDAGAQYDNTFISSIANQVVEMQKTQK